MCDLSSVTIPRLIKDVYHPAISTTSRYAKAVGGAADALVGPLERTRAVGATRGAAAPRSGGGAAGAPAPAPLRAGGWSIAPPGDDGRTPPILRFWLELPAIDSRRI